MEPFARIFPEVVTALLTLAFGGLVWYLRADRAQLLSRLDKLADALKDLAEDVHEATIDHAARISALERIVDYHLRINGARVEQK